MQKPTTSANELIDQKITSAEAIIQQLGASCGITLNGRKAYDPQIHNPTFYSRVLKDSALGLGESYMDEWWDCEELDTFFCKILGAKLDSKVKIPLFFKIKYILTNIINFQTKTRAKKVAREHYNLGNELFSAMLDKHMNYSCGYWKTAQTLDEAQLAKMDLICQKLQLKPGMRLLDIGCGWGGLAKYAAENYAVNVVGVTISEEQYELAKKRCEGLPIEIRLQDYRDVNDKFDRVVSVGMFEHVGPLNYDTFMQVAHRALPDHGIFLLHTIGNNETTNSINEWTNKYIFPNGRLPSVAEIGKSIEKYFVMEDWHNFGTHYDKTLMSWHANFTQAWDQIKNKYDDRFYRMWRFYLLSCAGCFRARAIQLWQVVLSKGGIPGGYVAPR